MSDRQRSVELDRDLLWLQEVDSCPPRPDGQTVSRLRSAVQAAVIEQQLLGEFSAPDAPPRLAGRIKQAVRRELGRPTRSAGRWRLLWGAAGLAAAACIAMLFTLPSSRPNVATDWPEWLDGSGETDALAVSFADLDDDFRAVEAGVSWISADDGFDGSLEALSDELDRVGAEVPLLPGFRTG